MRRSPRGVTTSDVTFSTYLGGSETIFPDILNLHVAPGAVIADVTYGKGVFWRNVDVSRYTLLPTDIATGVDCRTLPYDDESIDCVVLDPPYMEGFYREDSRNLAGRGSYGAFRSSYSNGTEHHEPKYQAAVTALYVDAGREAARVLRKDGVFIVKCQDAVCANRQHLTHVEIINEYAAIGFYAKDLFILVRNNRPAVSRLIRQRHARKNHSYFLVLVKT